MIYSISTRKLTKQNFQIEERGYKNSVTNQLVIENGNYMPSVAMLHLLLTDSITGLT